MPCYSVQRLNVELNNADKKLLAKALAKLGYTVTHTETNFSFKKDSVSGVYRNNKLEITNTDKSKPVNTDAIKVEYSKQVVVKMADKYKAQGWNCKKTADDTYEFTKDPTTETVQA
jgi:hypothetical protein